MNKTFTVIMALCDKNTSQCSSIKGFHMKMGKSMYNFLKIIPKRFWGKNISVAMWYTCYTLTFFIVHFCLIYNNGSWP